MITIEKIFDFIVRIRVITFWVISTLKISIFLNLKFDARPSVDRCDNLLDKSIGQYLHAECKVCTRWVITVKVKVLRISHLDVLRKPKRYIVIMQGYCEKVLLIVYVFLLTTLQKYLHERSNIIYSTTISRVWHCKRRLGECNSR